MMGEFGFQSTDWYNGYNHRERELQVENKALNKELETAFYLLEKTSTEVENDAENKALKELEANKHKRLKNLAGKYYCLQQSRDELLAFLNQARGIIGKHLSKNVWFDDFWWNELDDIIQNAQALKEKEE